MAGVQRHLLDDAQLVVVVEAEPQQRHRVVEAGRRVEHGVHLHRPQARPMCRGKARQHVGEPVAAGDVGEALGVDGVERHVDPVQPGPLQACRAAVQPNSVGGQGDLGAGPQRGGRGHDLLEMLGDQRFAAGEADAGDAESGDRDAQQPGQLVEGQQLLAGHPVQPLGGHAVRAPQIAAIGQRHPQIGGDAAVGVEQRPVRRGTLRIAGRDPYTDGTPSDVTVMRAP